MDRRYFIRTSSLATAALMAPLSGMSEIWSRKELEAIGVQVYTVRKELQTDFEGTIKNVANIGYNYLELFNYVDGKIYQRPVKEISQIMADNNIKPLSLHVATGTLNPNVIGTLSNNWEQVVLDAKEMGLEYLVCPYLAPGERKTIDDYKRLADLLNKSAELSAKYGIQFAYHNHDFEFMTLDNELPYDLLLKQTDKNLVKMELDIYWVTKAGKDPIELFKAHPGRFPLWHVKDMSKNERQYFTEVGNGSINWKVIFENSEIAGMKRFFVEQDICRDHTPVESLAISYKYLKALQY